MLGYLILLFTLVPVIELTLLIRVGQFIGLGPTVFIVIFTGVTGAYLARMQGLLILRKIQEEVNQGHMPADKLFDGLIVLCSGVLLLTPGFITDILGLIGLFPLTRQLLKRWLRRKIEDMISGEKVISISSYKFH